MRCSNLVAALGLCVPAAAQSEWIVDRTGGGQFTEIQPAVDAAAPGDRILVRAGSYAGFRLGKGLAIEAATLVTVDSVHIADLPAAQWARVSGLASGGTVPGLPASVAVQRCAGPVLLADLTLGQGLRVESSSAVLLTRATLDGAPAVWSSFTGFPALDARQSRVVVQDATLRGGNGLAGSPVQSPTPGGAALASTDSALLVAHSVLQGGLGGFPFQLGPGAPGGAALLARGSGARLVMAGGQLAGGLGTGGAPGGAAVDSSPLPAEVTTDVLLQGAVTGILALAPLTTLAATPVVPRGQAATLTVGGAPGTFVLPFFDLIHGHQVLAGLGQPLLVSFAAVPLNLVQIGPGGVLQLNLPVPADASLAHLRVLFQAVAAPGSGPASLTNLADVHIQ